MLRSRIDNKASEKGIIALSIELFGMISNIMESRYLKVPDKHTLANSDRKIRYF